MHNGASGVVAASGTAITLGCMRCVGGMHDDRQSRILQDDDKLMRAATCFTMTGRQASSIPWRLLLCASSQVPAGR
jgi:hypothetical protein